MGRPKKHEEEEKLERWLVSYADFITLLFAFFTVLYAISQADKSKYQKTAESIQRAFLSSGGIFPLQGSPFTPFEKSPDQGSVVPPSPTDEGKFAKENAESMERTKENIKSLFEKSTGLSLRPGDIDVFRTEQGYKIRLDESVVFKPGADRIKRTNIPFLYEMGKRLSRLGYQIQIEGYSDSGEKAGSENSWRLSLARSYNVMRFLIEATNFPKDQISVSGYGDSRPIASEDTPQGRARNRRVEIAVLTGNRSLADSNW